MKCIYNCFKLCEFSEFIAQDLFDQDICDYCGYYNEMLEEEREENKKDNGAR